MINVHEKKVEFAASRSPLAPSVKKSMNIDSKAVKGSSIITVTCSTDPFPRDKFTFRSIYFIPAPTDRDER